MKTPKIDFAIGGQAVIEGVMMRSPNFYTVSVRDPEGKIQMKQEQFKSIIHRIKLLKLPLIRGMVHLVESMMIGFKALDYSSETFLGEDAPDKEAMGPVKRFFYTVFTVLYTLFTLGFTLFLLKALPLWVAGKVAAFWPVVEQNYLLFNAVDGLTKITIFLSYISLIALMKDIRRVFQYHGAEHKCVWNYEAGLPLTIENARKQSRYHPRCGTSFLFIVILMSILVYTVIPPADGFATMLLQRILVIPLIAGVSYELLKFTAKFQDNFAIKLLTFPGLMIQRLTTREPDDQQLEIALHSLKASLQVERELVL